MIICADRHICRKFSESKSIVIPNVPPIAFLSPKEKLSSKACRKVVYVGTLHEQRGILKCLEAIQLVKDKTTELHIVGECKYPELLSAIQNAPRTVFHGRVPWENLVELLPQFDVGLALFQPTPAFTYYPGENIVKLFEYASHGIPFVISNFNGLNSFVEEHGGGITVDPTDPNAIAAVIDRLVNDTELYQKLSNEGVAMVRDQFNWEIQEQLLLDAYSKLL